jgi:diacylglycerol O-acyltransferase / wax synthase
MVTISLHHEQPGQARGNQPGWMMVPLPLGEPDPMRRLELIAAETAARKHKARPQAAAGSSGSPSASAPCTGTSRGSGR